MTLEKCSWRSESLGAARTLQLQQGELGCFEAGSGSAIVFVHGALVNANLWRKPIAMLAGEFRCIALDLPFGGHQTPMPADADLSPLAFADLIADAIEALDLEDVTLVGNDTGGAMCQLLATRRPERIGRLVLTSCEAFDNFPPKAVRPVLPLMLMPGALSLLLSPMRLSGVRSRSTTVGRLTKRPVDSRQAVDSWTYPALTTAGIRRDIRKAMKAMDSKFTLDAAERLDEFDRPTLIAWSREDCFFPRKHAQRLAELFPQGSLEWIEDSYTFSPEDQPARLAELIKDFASQPA